MAGSNLSFFLHYFQVFYTDHTAIFEMKFGGEDYTQSKPMQAVDLMNLPLGLITHYRYFMCTIRYCSQLH